MEHQLNDELVQASNPAQEKESHGTPKRNSKNAKIEKIKELCEKFDIDLPETDSQLKRMSKENLTKRLAACIEDGVRISACQQLNVDPELRNNDVAMSMGALRMVHNITARSFESSVNGGCLYLNAPYKMDGFCNALTQNQEEIDACLLEIAQEHPELLTYFKSPYARLGICWLTSALRCVRPRKINHLNKDVADLSSRKFETTKTV